MAKGPDVGMLLKNINESLERKVNNSLQKDGLTLAQIRVLAYIYQQPGHQTTQKQLEVYLDVAHPTINGILKRLAEKQLVTTEITVEERLSKTVTITEKGKEAAEKAKRTSGKHEKLLVYGISPDDEKLLIQLLMQIQQNINRIS